MPVGTIKRELTQFQKELVNCSTNCNSLIQALNGVTIATSLSITPHVSKLRLSIEKQDNILRLLSAHCHEELHIFFKSYNIALTRLIKKNKEIRTFIKDLNDIAKSLHELFIFDCEIEGFLEYNLSERDLKFYTPEIVQYKNELIKLQIETQQRNKELTRKARIK